LSESAVPVVVGGSSFSLHQPTRPSTQSPGGSVTLDCADVIHRLGICRARDVQSQEDWKSAAQSKEGARGMSVTQRSTRADSSRRCWTAAEVAAILGISKVSVYQALALGSLPGCRVGARWLVPMDALDKWLHEVAGRSD